MRKTREKVKNTIIDDLEVETIETIPEDGFIKQSELHPANSLDNEKRKTYIKGYSKTKTYTTNDPRITRPFAYSISAIFLLIGIILVMFRNYFFGIIFTLTSIFSFINSKKDIDAIAKEKMKQGKDVTIDSKEEAKQLFGKLSNIVKDDFKDIKKSVWSKENYKVFLKLSLPIYILVAIFISIICFIANIVLGIFTIMILIIIGFIFFYIIYKICDK